MTEEVIEQKTVPDGQGDTDIRKMLGELLKEQMTAIKDELKNAFKEGIERVEVEQPKANPNAILGGVFADPNAVLEARVNLLRASGYKEEVIPEVYEHWFGSKIVVEKGE